MATPTPPDKESDSYDKLKAALRRSADKHFEAPQAAPPAVKKAQEENPELAPPAKPLREGETPPEEMVDVKRKKYWIKSPALRMVICLLLLGVTGYCLWYIHQFKLRGETGEIWWPWQKPPTHGHRYPTNVAPQKAAAKPTTTTNKQTAAARTTTTTVAKVETKQSSTEARKLAETKPELDEAAQAKAAEAERKKQELAALAKLETDEMQSLAALEASLKGYRERFQYEQGSQQMSQLGSVLKSDKAKARLQELWTTHQPYLDFKQTLIANMASITYDGKPLTNKQGGTLMGTPKHADAEKIYLSGKYGEAAAAWETIAADQIALLADYYLKAREKQTPSKAIAKDYLNLMWFCLSNKLTTRAAQAGTDAMTVDQSLRPQVKAALGNLVP
jgi:hypothetical protein